MGRARRLTGEAAKFSLVNVTATLVALVLFNLLVHGIQGLYAGPLHAHPLSTYVLANSVGMVLSFLGSRHLVYRHREAIGPAGGALNYAVVNYVSFLIPIGCLWLTRNAFGWDNAVSDNLAGNVVGAALATVFRFWAFRRFVFRSHRPIVVRRHLEPHAPGGHHLVDPPMAWDDPRWPGALGSVGSVDPEVGPAEAELLEHQAQQGQADADDVVRIAGDAGDEGAASPVEGEGSRHL